MRIFAISLVILLSMVCTAAQQTTSNSGERRVALTESAVALDATGASVLEAGLRTTALSGAPDMPITNIRMVVKNSSNIAYSFVSGLVTFYDASGVRCGDGLFKADAVAAGESFETDTPGIRIRCTPSTWRVVVTSVLPRVVPSLTSPPLSKSNFVITVDGEQHPIQLDKPMTLNFGDKQRVIIVREAP